MSRAQIYVRFHFHVITMDTLYSQYTAHAHTCYGSKLIIQERASDILSLSHHLFISNAVQTQVAINYVKSTTHRGMWRSHIPPVVSVFSG
jgi:hypothetical protein